MVLNELATNAAKHGSLSVPSGRVALKWWCADGERGQSLHLHWREHGGPEVKRSDRRGFGSVLIERTIAHELRGKVVLEFAPSGLVCDMEIPLQEATGHG
jgi:two-component sensor histidine kinase